MCPAGGATSERLGSEIAQGRVAAAVRIELQAVEVHRCSVADIDGDAHLHCLITDGAFEEHGTDLRFLATSAPTLERMTAVLAHVDDAVGTIDDDLDLDPSLAACVQRSLAGPHVAPATEPVTRPPMTVSAFGMNLHAATTVDGRDRKESPRGENGTGRSLNIFRVRRQREPPHALSIKWRCRA